ncbi:MAG: YkoF family thiamine/hydroxymethylpyrimidine-binding protein [Halioglobus sp.]
MKLTAELSLYPLQDEYIPIIQAFIEAVRKYPNIVVVSNAMSTQVCGEYEQIFTLIREELAASYQRFGTQVLVCKFIVGELDIQG